MKHEYGVRQKSIPYFSEMTIDTTKVSEHRSLEPLPLNVLSIKNERGEDIPVYITTVWHKSGSVSITLYCDSKKNAGGSKEFIGSFEAMYLGEHSDGHWTINHREIKPLFRSHAYPNDIAHFSITYIEHTIKKLCDVFGMCPYISNSSSRPSVVRLFQKCHYTTPPDNFSNIQARRFNEYMRQYRKNKHRPEIFLHTDPYIGSPFLLVKRDTRGEILIDKTKKGYDKKYFIRNGNHVGLSQEGARIFGDGRIPYEVRVHFLKELP